MLYLKMMKKQCINEILNPYRAEDKSLRHKVGKIMPAGMKSTIKKIIK